MVNSTMKNVLITGQPGIGKTTLVKKFVEHLKSQNVECSGFYTEEIRNNNYRIGFDIVTFEGERAILARKSSDGVESKNRPKVGQYEVYVEEFEKIALPILQKPNNLMIVDEIGKMEMFSKKFEEAMRNILKSAQIKLIATVPLKGGPLLVKQMKDNRNNELITVNYSNRDNLLQEIVKYV